MLFIVTEDAYELYKTLYNIKKSFKEFFDDPFDKVLPCSSSQLETIFEEEEEEINTSLLNEAYYDEGGIIIIFFRKDDETHRIGWCGAPF